VLVILKKSDKEVTTKCLSIVNKLSYKEQEVQGKTIEASFGIGTNITKLNSILWDRYVTPKTKTHIYHAIVKSTITYAAETWCLKAKTVSKLNSTEMDFWR